MLVCVKTTARIAGLLYLINIVLSFFAIGYVPGILMSNDAAITVQNILIYEQLYRSSLVAHLIILLTNFPLAVIWLKIFKPVHNKQFANDFSQEQLASLSFLFHRLTNVGVNLAFFFFGFYGISVGYLIIRSPFFPKIIGAAMAIGRACYIFNSLANFLCPSFASTLLPYILVPPGLAELSFCLWLLVIGVNARKWELKRSGITSISVLLL